MYFWYDRPEEKIQTLGMNYSEKVDRILLFCFVTILPWTPRYVPNLLC